MFPQVSSARKEYLPIDLDHGLWITTGYKPSHYEHTVIFYEKLHHDFPMWRLEIF